MKKELIDELYDELHKLKEEKMDLYFSYIKEYANSYNKLSYESRDKLQNEFKKYLKCYDIYVKLLKYMINNVNHIKYDNAEYIIDLLDEKFEEIISYIFNMLEEFDVALNMQLDYKFNPKEKNIFINDDNLIEYMSYIKGFSMDNVSNFLILNNVYSPSLFFDIYNDIKIIDCNKEDYYTYSGVNEDGKVMVPKINDELSSLINIHELVHKALLIKKEEIANDKIINGEELPIFYELLFQKDNYFCNEEIHENELADKLLDDYKNEPFEEQIIKLKRII